MTPPQILYVAGYSRSGSTILDMILGRNPEVASTGELTYLLDDAENPNRFCTCGERYVDCVRFGPWLASSEGKAALTAKDRLRALEGRSGLEALRSGDVSPEDAALYRAYATSLYGHLAESAGARIILDSSKSAKDAAGRPLALARLAGLPVKVLHLTRDPRAVVMSYIKTGSNWVAEGHRKPKPLDSFRPVMGWAKANGIAADLQAEFGADYLRVRYEDIMADPEGELTRIGAFVGVDFSDELAAARAGDAFLAEHNVGGNRTRLEPQTIRLAAENPVTLPLPYTMAYRIWTAATARKLGYV